MIGQAVYEQLSVLEDLLIIAEKLHGVEECELLDSIEVVLSLADLEYLLGSHFYIAHSSHESLVGNYLTCLGFHDRLEVVGEQVFLHYAREGLCIAV